jgi:hypothetical protein
MTARAASVYDLRLVRASNSMIASDELNPTVPLDKQKAYFFSFNITSSALACGLSRHCSIKESV